MRVSVRFRGKVEVKEEELTSLAETLGGAYGENYYDHPAHLARHDRTWVSMLDFPDLQGAEAFIAQLPRWAHEWIEEGQTGFPIRTVPATSNRCYTCHSSLLH